MNNYKYKTFEEIISEVFENGNLKKGYRVILTNIRTSCVRCSKTTFEFILDYIEIENKKYMLSKSNNIEKEIFELYYNLKGIDKEIREEKLLDNHNKSVYQGSELTLFYYNKIVCSEQLYGLYKFEPLYEKLLIYKKYCKYTARNSADISYMYKDAFNSIQKLEKDYKFIIEYGMKTKTGVSIFSSYTLTSNSDAPYGCIAKSIDRAERLLRLQEKVYTKQENSLIYLIMELRYKDKIILKKEFTTFTDCIERTLSIRDIVASIIRDVRV